MARFEHRGQGRFVEVTLDGAAVRIVTGALGAKGVPVDRTFADEAAARAEVKTLGEQLLGRGYIHVRTFEEVAEQRPHVVPPASPSASSAELEAAIDADRAHPEPYLVYADWLQARGDPRGELIVVQHAIAEAGAKVPEALRKREAQILVEHQDALLGDLVYERADSTLEWRYGFLRAATLHPSDDVQSLATIVGDLLAHPSSRFLEELTLGLPHGGRRGFHYGDVAEAMARHGERLRGLRALAVGETNDERRMSVDRIAGEERLWPLVPGLRRLSLRWSPAGDPAPIELPQLEEARLEVPADSIDWSRWVAALHAPALRTLELEWAPLAGADQNPRQGMRAALARIEPAKFPALRRLALRGSAFAETAVGALPYARIVGQLERLDLSQGRFEAASIEPIAEMPLLRKFREIDLSRCGLAPAAVARLRAALPNAILDPQTPPDHRYDDADE